MLEKERKELEPLEEELKSKLPEKVRKVNSKKQTQLLKKLLQEMKYPDVEVALKCLTGFPLIGDLDTTGVFSTRKLEEFNIGADPIWLARMAKQSRKALIKGIEKEDPKSVMQEIYALTTHPETREVAKGWANGPCTEQEIHDRCGHQL